MTSRLRLRVATERWPLREAFTIARGEKREAIVVVVELHEGELAGRGEALPYARYGEDPEGVAAQIAALAPQVEAGLTRDELTRLLPPGAARNALDLALWDLEARRRGEPVWRMAGLSAPAPVVTAYTIPIRDLAQTRALARREAGRPLLKVKLGAGDDLARVQAVRDEAPGARLIVDANEGWNAAALFALAPRLAELGVELIEQPLPAADDGALEGWQSPVALCADESFHGGAIDALPGRYVAVNVKLDKQGGLTSALEAMTRAVGLGLDVMVGTMVATSLAVAPAVLLAGGARWADVDAPLFLARDREHGLRFEGSIVHPPDAALWGG